ncbi:MAG: hypothetical protein ACXW4Q_07770 [Anaerolineales bacterium]
MNKTLRNFWLDIILYLLLGVNIALVNLTPPAAEGVHPALGWHIHAMLGILLTLGCLIHIAWHWQWFQAVLTGKAKGKIKLGMITMVTVMMLLASLSGHDAMTSTAASSFHSFTGSLALVGLFIHGVKHIRWMALTSKRLIAHGGQKNVIQSV